MYAFHNPKTLFVDVDETLIHYDIDFENCQLGILKFSNDGGNHYLPVQEIKTATSMVRKFKALGYEIYVWSQSGGDWAETVVKGLGLEDCVTACFTKPTWYLDDLVADKWMGPRIDPYATKRE